MRFFSRPKIGLALSSGGAKGIAHIGVLKVLLKNDIPIDYIAGTSVGALFGGMFAARGNIESVEHMINTFKLKDFIKLFSDFTTFRGFFKGDKIAQFIEEKVEDKDIENLDIPFRAIAVNVLSGAKKVLSKGSLVDAIRASISIPVIFQPLRMKNKFLIDGAAAEPVPVQTVRRMGAKKVIAVNVNNYFGTKEIKQQNLSKLAVLQNACEIAVINLSTENVKMADVVINPQIEPLPLTKFLGSKDLINVGEKAAEEMIGDIKRLVRKRIIIF